jgi:hypothetical protein
MKMRTIDPDLLARVVATPEKTDLSGVAAITDEEALRIMERNGNERRGFVFVGQRDGSDTYVDLKKERIGSQYENQYENAA